MDKTTQAMRQLIVAFEQLQWLHQLGVEVESVQIDVQHGCPRITLFAESPACARIGGITVGGVPGCRLMRAELDGAVIEWISTAVQEVAHA